MKTIVYRLLLSVALLLCCVVVAYAESLTFAYNDIKYKVINDAEKTVEVVSNPEKAYSGSITIPATVTDGNAITYTVTEIGDLAFYECSNLTSVSIPSNVTSIGESAFNGCSSLADVNIPNAVTAIKFATFHRCSSLTSVEIPSNVTNIGGNAFRECRSLTSVNIPNKVTEIGNAAFFDCTSLTSVNIPNSMTNIEEYAFRNCASLTSINIPSSVRSIGKFTFQECASLTSVDLPSTFTEIVQGMFYSCTSLTSVIIPANVQSIGSDAFKECSSLENILLLTSTPPMLDTSAFSDIATTAAFYVPDEAKATYTNAGWNNIAPYSNYLEKCIEVIGNAKTDEVMAALTKEESQTISTGIENIGQATSVVEGIAETAKAMEIITVAEVRPSMGEDKDSPYLNNLVKAETNVIGAARTLDEIFAAKATAKTAAMKKINSVIGIFQAAKSDLLGTQQTGPAIEVTKGDRTIILYNPKKVNFINVNKNNE